MAYLNRGGAVAVAIITLAGSTAAFAAGKPASPGSSLSSPGHEMKAAGGPVAGASGASQYSPGHEMNAARTSTPPGKSADPGASGFAPGDLHSKGHK